MTAVRAPDLGCVGLRLGDGDAFGDEHGKGRHDHAVDALAVAERVRRVDDVVACRAEMHEALCLVGHVRADDVDERPHVVPGARLLLGHLLRGDAVGGARDRVPDALIGNADVRKRKRERAYPSDRTRGANCVVHPETIFAAFRLRISLIRTPSWSSLVASISAARMPAFTAPESPTATVATGMPRGIWTVERSASSPPAIAFGATSGTPITGSVVSAATAPARCAAPPAPQITTRTPRPSSPSTQSRSASGVRCAESTRVSLSTPRLSRVSEAKRIVVWSDVEPMTIATFDVVKRPPPPAARCPNDRTCPRSSRAPRRRTPDRALPRCCRRSQRYA